MYRDLNPVNILFDPQHEDQDEDILKLKIVDFGLPVEYDNKKEQLKDVGNCFYMAPELLYNEDEE